MLEEIKLNLSLNLNNVKVSLLSYLFRLAHYL